MKNLFVFLPKISETDFLESSLICMNKTLNNIAEILKKHDIELSILYSSSNFEEDILSIYLSDFIIVYNIMGSQCNIGYEIAIANFHIKPIFNLTTYVNSLNFKEVDANDYGITKFKTYKLEQNTTIEISDIKDIVYKVLNTTFKITSFPMNLDPNAHLIKNYILKKLHEGEGCNIISLINKFDELNCRFQFLFPEISSPLKKLINFNDSKILQYREIQNSFPVEIAGIKCQELDEEKIFKLKSMLSQYKLIIIRGQNLTQEEQIKFTSFFGAPDIAWDNRNRDSIFQHIQVINNKNGGDYYYSRKKMSTIRFWHSDTSFLANPTRYTFLHIKEIPKEGGDTKFINTQLAYQHLPEEIKELIKDKKACHSFNYIFGEILKERNLERKDKLDDVFHPLVRSEEKTESLYLNKLTISHIEGLEYHESEKLLTKLYEHCKKNIFRYTHKWSEGDILIWDNFSTMHKGTFTDPIYQRELNRTTIKHV